MSRVKIKFPDTICPPPPPPGYSIDTMVLYGVTRLDDSGNVDWIISDYVKEGGKIIDITGLNVVNKNGSFGSSLPFSTQRCLSIAEDSLLNKYIIGYFDFFLGQAAPKIIKLNPDGTVNTGFNSGTGINGITTSLANSRPFKVFVDSNDKIYIIGNFNSYNGTSANSIVRLNSDGSIDSSFNYGTGFIGANSNERTVVSDMVEDSNGKLYFIGAFTSYNGTSANGIISLNPDGTINTAFNYGSGFNNRTQTFMSERIAIDSNDKLFCTGNFQTYNGITANRVISLNTDGTINTAFSAGSALNNHGTAIFLGSGGKIYVGGAFTNPNRIIRFNPDGTVDSSFNIGTGFNTLFPMGIIEKSNGKIYVGGYFTSYNGTLANYIISLNQDGSINTSFNYGTGFDDRVEGLNLLSNENLYVCGRFESYNGI